jgi:hypothetical protein
MGVAPTRVALIAHYALSVASFRGALIRALVQRGVQVWVLAPDFTPATRDQVAMLGGQPADYFLNRTGANPFHDIRSCYIACEAVSGTANRKRFSPTE